MQDYKTNVERQKALANDNNIKINSDGTFTFETTITQKTQNGTETKNLKIQDSDFDKLIAQMKEQGIEIVEGNS